MADEVISTKIVADADFSGLIADVHKITASLSKLQEQLANSNKMLANNVAVINRNFADTLRSTGQFSSHFVSLTSDVEKFGKNLDSGRLKLRDYFNTYQGHIKTSGGLIRELARQQVAMQNAILQPLGRNAQGLMQFNVHVPRGLDEIKNKTSIARQELAIMNKVIQDGAVQLINWGKNTQWAGRQLTVGLTLPIAAFGKAAADAFKVADQELTRLTKVYGDVAGTSAAELGRVRKEVIATSKELSAAYGTNFSETIALSADIAATGKKGQELLDSVRETSRLAVLGEVDRQEAMKATLAIQSAFKSNTTELAESINFLNAVENQTSTTLNDLVEAIPKAGPVIKGLGGDVQDLALYLTAMREGGVSASEGANALKSALASLINPTDKAVEKFQGFGIDLLGIVNRNAGDVTATLMSLQSALDTLSPLQKQQAIEQLFGKFQFSRLNALFENLGREGSQTLQVLDLMKASTSELAAVAGRELTAVTESASGKYRRALESLKADLAGVGEQFLTIGTKIITIVDKALNFFQALPKPIKNALTFLGALTAVAGPLIMLTGLLANFFGYILKGVMHMKAFFKGGEGWKYLTPEMLAAEKAGKLVEQTFYSDAKAASILQLALKNLIDEFSILEAKAKSGSISVNPAVSTMAGNVIMGAGGRIVNPQHPLAGPMGTRASTHMVPRASMTEEQRMSQTIFGLVPGSVPVNRKIGDAPQIYMNDPLPPVPGLTTIGGVSTGVVSGEAARWHAMMATLAMQSKSEIEALKKQIATTGIVSKDFMNQFDDILPVVSGITDNAAKQSALIVAELRAGKLTVEQARAQIIALNLEIERMITSAVGQQAALMGRTINPTMVPTLNQPVVDPTGKSNMRELFKKSKTRDLIDKVARSLGVRTSGAGYNIETTKPRKMNTGGFVYGMNDGNIVPGPNINKDVVPAMLTPGEFVVNREATAANLPLLMAINGTGGTGGPGFNSGGYQSARRGVERSLGQIADMYADPRYFDQKRTEAIVNDAWGIFQAAKSAGKPISYDKAIDYASMMFDDTVLAAGGLMSDDGRLLRPGSQAEFDRLRSSGEIHKKWERKFGFNLLLPKKLSDALKNAQTRDEATKIKNIIRGKSQMLAPKHRAGIHDVMRQQGYYGIDTVNPYDVDRAHTVRIGNLDRHAIGFIGQAVAAPQNINREMSRLEGYGVTRNYIPMFPDDAKREGRLFARRLGTNLAGVQQTARNPIGPRTFQMSGLTKAITGGFGPRGYSRYLRMGQAAFVQRNSGGMIRGYNRGGMVGGVRYMQDGGMASKGMATSFAGMGLMGAGSMVGGNIGQAMSFAGMAMQMMPLLSFLPKLPVALTKTIGPFAGMASSVTKLSTGLGGLSKVFNLVLKPLALILRAINPVTAGLTLLAIGVKLYIDRQKELAEQHRITRLGFGMSAESAKNAGYTYTDYNKKVKDAIGNLKAMAERNKILYESMTQAGVPFKMTIEQYKKLKETVKDTMGDYVKLFDSTKVKDVGQVAVQLKAQFMAAGDSAEEATAKIYTLIGLSNKAGMAGAAIGTSSFKGIQTVQDAAEATIKTFNAATQVSDAKGQVDALLSAFTALDAATTKTVEDSKKNSKDKATATITEYDAATQVVEKINNKLGKQKTITSEMIVELSKMNPELGQILSTSDTVVTAFQKLKLLSSGINIDVSQLSGTAAAAASQIISSVQSAVRNNNLIKQQTAAYQTLKNQISAAERAQRGMSAKQEIDSRKAIQNLQKQIALIKDQAKTKIDAIRKQTEAENAELEIQKEQLAASQALVSGDMTSYAQSQLNIKQIVNTQQQKAAEEAITEKAELDIKPLQDQIDALQDKNQKLADTAALAGDKLAYLQKKAGTLNDNLTIYTTNLDNLAFKVKTLGDSFRGSDEYKEAMVALKEAGKKLGIDADPEKVLNDIVKGLGNISTDLVNIYLAGGGKAASFGQGGTSSNPRNLGQSKYDLRSWSNPFSKGPSSVREMVKGYAQTEGVLPGEYFTLTDKDGKEYKFKVREDGNITMVTDPYTVKKAMGGRIVPGIPYMLNDGGKVEGIKFDMPGMVYPNINTMPKYNIPTNTISGVRGVNNGAYNNSVYNIDISLNGTNVTADDVVRKFKQELALINAKEGRSRTTGGRY
jgi:TP901 family phage tail tape measure protein